LVLGSCSRGKPEVKQTTEGNNTTGVTLEWNWGQGPKESEYIHLQIAYLAKRPPEVAAEWSFLTRRRHTEADIAEAAAASIPAGSGITASYSNNRTTFNVGTGMTISVICGSHSSWPDFVEVKSGQANKIDLGTGLIVWRVD